MWEEFLSLFFPRVCVHCNKSLQPSESVLCLPCFLQLPKMAPDSQTDNPVLIKFRNLTSIEHAYFYLHYQKQSAVQQLFRNLKYKNRPDVGIQLGKWFGQYLQEYNLHKQFDAIIPIPLHPKKQKRRGYNQSEKIAEGMSEVLDIEVLSNILVRTKETQTQTKKHKIDRWNTMQSIFSLTDQTALKNRRIIIIDDVVTTGATMESAVLTVQDASPDTISIGGIATGKA